MVHATPIRTKAVAFDLGVMIKGCNSSKTSLYKEYSDSKSDGISETDGSETTKKVGGSDTESGGKGVGMRL